MKKSPKKQTKKPPKKHHQQNTSKKKKPQKTKIVKIASWNMEGIQILGAFLTLAITHTLSWKKCSYATSHLPYLCKTYCFWCNNCRPDENGDISPVTPTPGPSLPPASPSALLLLITRGDRGSPNALVPRMMLKSQHLAW